MAKAAKKKTATQASAIFAGIIKASVKGNPISSKKKTTKKKGN